MIKLNIYNSDADMRHHYFPIFSDPDMLEKTILELVNIYRRSMCMQSIGKFNMSNTKLSNMYFTYYTTSNYLSWGSLPLNYIYNDMVRHIRRMKTDKNFILTLESIYMEFEDNDYLLNSIKDYLPNIITEKYVSRNYIISSDYMNTNSNGLMIVYAKYKRGVIAYILSVGFDQYYMARWFNTSQNVSEYSMPYNRYLSLCDIVKDVGSKFYIDIGPIEYESSISRMMSDIDSCYSFVNANSIGKIRHSKNDSTIKYGNYNMNPIDFIIDNNTPACFDINGYSVFNYDSNYTNNSEIINIQNDILKGE